ncbi:MAG: type I-E CRISPR-associated protein Cse2/CasB [Azospirillaceae bacterium]|nr:type I-E CRISPR-associated protein Cse2/CasB [Azospirillaceae bacterium]
MTEIAGTAVRKKLDGIVFALSQVLRKERLGTGPLAQLRRMDPLGVPPPAFWPLFFEVVDPEAKGESTERAWAIIVQAMAMMGPEAHQGGRRAGRALADSGYPEGRFVRLLRGSGEALATEVRTLSRWCLAKGLGFDWTDLAALILARQAGDPERADRAVLRLARSYFQPAAPTVVTETALAGDEA